MSKILLPATLEGFNLHKDGGASLRFITQELSDEDVITIKQFYGKFGWLGFRENEWQDEDFPAQNAIFEGKTPAQRLRNVIFVWYKELEKQGKAKDVSFNSFYDKRVEEVIEHIKIKLSAPPLA